MNNYNFIIKLKNIDFLKKLFYFETCYMFATTEYMLNEFHNRQNNCFIFIYIIHVNISLNENKAILF